MSTIEDRLAEALRGMLKFFPLYVVSGAGNAQMNAEALIQEALAAYDAQKADPCPTAEHWLSAIVELYGSEAEDLAILKQRAIVLAKEGEA